MQKEKESVHLKRNRQKKIGNLKTYIVLFVLLSILLSLVSNIYLFVKVIKLEKKINKISLNRIIRRANSKKKRLYYSLKIQQSGNRRIKFKR